MKISAKNSKDKFLGTNRLTKIGKFFFHHLRFIKGSRLGSGSGSGSGSESPDFQFEDPDPKLLISDTEHCDFQWQLRMKKTVKLTFLLFAGCRIWNYLQDRNPDPQFKGLGTLDASVCLYFIFDQKWSKLITNIHNSPNDTGKEKLPDFLTVHLFWPNTLKVDLLKKSWFMYCIAAINIVILRFVSIDSIEIKKLVGNAYP